MKSKLFMSVDLGTSYIKSGVYSLDGIRHAFWSEPVLADCPEPGTFIQPGERLYRSAHTCIRKMAEMLGERAKEISAIAFTGQMAGFIGVGENWEDMTTWSCSLDRRYLPWAQRQREQYGEEQFRISGTGAPVLCAKHAWFRSEFPEKYDNTVKYMMLNGYIIGRLSQIPVEKAQIDYSMIAWTGLADVREHRWSERLCEEMGVDLNMLPRIERSTKISGYLCEEAAEELLLPAGIPLVLGAGDKISGCIGAGVFDEGEFIFEAASYGAVSCKVKEFRPDYRAGRYDIIGSTDDDSYFVHKYIQGSGIAADWFMKEFMCDDSSTDQREAFRKAEALCARMPAGSDRMMAIGLLGGSAIPFDGELRGLFMGHTWSHTKNHFYHALLESFSYDLALTLERIDHCYPEYRKNAVRIIGGGAGSAMWSQMLADVTGRRFEWLDRDDIALWGNALIAAAGVGELSDLRAAAKEHAAVKKVYIPDEGRYHEYQPYIRLYESVTAQMHEVYERLNNL